VAPRRKLPDITTLRLLRAEGQKLHEIAGTYGVGESAVWKALERGGLTNPLPTFHQIVPWEIEGSHRKTAIMDHIRTIARERAGGDVSPGRLAYAHKWINYMENSGLVLAYDPTAPANIATRNGGFHYLPRTENDEWIFRVPTDTTS
jgi:hypothetical protein